MADNPAESCFCIGQSARGLDHLSIQPVQSVADDAKQKLFLALYIIIKPGFGNPKSFGNVAHRGGFVAPFMEDPGGFLVYGNGAILLAIMCGDIL